MQAIGIELGTSQVHLAQALRLGEQTLITRSWQLLPGQALPRDGSVAASCLPTGQAILRKFKVPFADPQKIAQIVYYESERYIHSRPIEELATAYCTLERQPESSRLLVAAAPKEVLRAHLQELERKGISPQAVTLDSLALLYAAQRSGQLDPSQNQALLYLREGWANLIVLVQGQLHELRAIRWVWPSTVGPGEPLEETVELRPTQTNEDAAVGLPEKKDWPKLARKIERTCLGVEVHSLFLAGESPEGLPSFLQEHLALPIRSLDLSSLLAPGLNQAQVSPVAVGLALQALEAGDQGLNFRQGEFRYTRGFERCQKPLAWALTLLMLLLALLAEYCRYERKPLAAGYAHLLSQAEHIAAQYEVSQTPDEYGSRLEEIRSRLGNLQKPALPQIADVRYRFAALLAQIQQVRQQYLFTVEYLLLDQEEAAYSGRMEEKTYAATLDLLVRKLRQLPDVLPGEEGTHLLYHKPLTEPKNKALSHEYKIQLRFRSEQ